MARNIKYAIDMITLYEPSWWGLTKWRDFADRKSLPPEKFWHTALDAIAETGADGIRTTFGPSHWLNALEYFGSGEKFREQLANRGLELAAGFYVEVGHGNILDPARQAEIIEEVGRYADFLKAAGSEIMVVGFPHRKSWNDATPLFVDLDYARTLADLCNRIGYETLKRGVKMAIHPKTEGTLWLKRDIDLFLLLTDPIYVWFCPDTCHMSLGGSDVVQILREHRDRVCIADWKDAKGTVSRQIVKHENSLVSLHPYYAFVGEGDVDWKAWVGVLKDMQYKGWAVVELDATKKPVEEIKQALAYIKTNLEPIYS